MYKVELRESVGWVVRLGETRFETWLSQPAAQKFRVRILSHRRRSGEQRERELQKS
jgi:hypothetical protein